jgi:two-component system response regulator AgrA
MLSIFICEDDTHYLELITKAVEKCVWGMEYDANVVVSTSDHSEIMRFILENGTHHGLYFLDIELEGDLNGIQIASEIRKHDPRAYIVFVTAYDKYMGLTFKYQVEAMDYINKEVGEEVLQKRIAHCIKNTFDRRTAKNEHASFVFKERQGRKTTCDHKDILFFETDVSAQKTIIIHTRKRQYSMYGTLDKVLKETSESKFYKCHQSFIVNTDNLTNSCREDLEAEKTYMTMPNGSECQVSNRARKELLKIIKRREEEQKLVSLQHSLQTN